MIILHTCWSVLWFDGWDNIRDWRGAVKVAVVVITHMVISCLVRGLQWLVRSNGIITRVCVCAAGLCVSVYVMINSMFCVLPVAKACLLLVLEIYMSPKMLAGYSKSWIER